MWGSEQNDHYHYWVENDFEILSTVYRAEVESFLNWVDQYFTFEDGRLIVIKPSKGKDKAGVSSPLKSEGTSSSLAARQLADSSTRVRDAPPHMSNEDFTHKEISRLSADIHARSEATEKILDSPEHSARSKEQYEDGLDQIRRAQSQRYMSRPSIHGTNPYLQVPTRIAGTQKMG